MSNLGWVAIHRKLKDKGYYKDSEVVHIWLHLLLSVNHKPNEFIFNGETRIIETGQMITGRKSIAEATGINEHKVDRSLELLERMGQIKQLKTTKNRLIIILNWEKYQTSEQQVSNKLATSEKQVSTNINVNNINNDNNVIDTPAQSSKSFFYKVGEGGKTLIEFIEELHQRTGVPSAVLSQEVKKFHSYWTELDSTGKRQRWQKQETFEVQKRFGTWLRNAGKFNGASAPKGKQII